MHEKAEENVMDSQSDWSNIEDFQALLEKACASAAEKPDDDTSVKMCRKLSQLLSKRHQISRVCLSLNFFIFFFNLKFKKPQFFVRLSFIN